MAKRFRMRVEKAIDERNYKAPSVANCDILVEKIQWLFVQCENVMSLADKQHLLTMLTTIEKNNRCVSKAEKQAMYNHVYTMIDRYKMR